MVIDPDIRGFSPDKVKIHLHTFDHSSITFGIILLCLGSSNTSHVDSLDRFRKTVVDKVKFDIRFFKRSILKNKI